MPSPTAAARHGCRGRGRQRAGERRGLLFQRAVAQGRLDFEGRSDLEEEEVVVVVVVVHVCGI